MRISALVALKPFSPFSRSGIASARRSVAAAGIRDIAVVAGLAVNEGMLPRYRRVLQHDRVLRAPADTADAAELDGNQARAVAALNFQARDDVRHDPILQQGRSHFSRVRMYIF